MITWQFLVENVSSFIYIAPLLFSIAIMLGLAIFSLRKKEENDFRIFVFLLLSIAFWSFSYMMELLFTDSFFTLFWYKVRFIGIVLTPVAWLLFVLHYTGRKGLVNEKTLYSLLVVPVLNLFILFTNDMHHLFWEEITVTKALDSMTVAFGEGAPFFWFHSVYSYILILAGIFLVSDMLLHVRRAYFKQSLVLLIGAIAPFIGNFVYVTGLIPLPFTYDVTPIFFVFTGVIYSWAIFKFSFIDVAPIARDEVFENIENGVIVLDKKGRVVDLNKSAENIFNDYGNPFKDKIQDERTEDFFSENLFDNNLVFSDEKKELELSDGTNRRYFEITSSPIFNQGEKIDGKIVIMRDITEQKKIQDKLEEKIEKLEEYKKVTVGRELKMRELKKKIKELEGKKD